MSKLSRRTLVATAAALPALVVPAGAALASDEDPELLVLGIEFEKVAVDWVRQRRSDRQPSSAPELKRLAAFPLISARVTHGFTTIKTHPKR